MEQDSINKIMQNALDSKSNNNLKNEREIIKCFEQVIKNNYDLLEKANLIDLHNNNGFTINSEKISKIFAKYLKMIPLVKQKNDVIINDKDLLYSKIYSSLGIIHIIFDGNPYIMLELILLGILTNNTMIFSYNGYMNGTNGLLITLIQSLLEKNNYKKEMFQHSCVINPEKYFDCFKTINKTIIIGDNDFQNVYLKLCCNNTLISGYNNFDIYIDDLTHIDIIKKILSQYTSINVYINSSLNYKLDDAFIVDDIEEAITQINYNSSGFCSAIFTQNNNNASIFIKAINSKNVMVNASPTLEQQFDIKQEDLLMEKTIVLPNIYKFDGKTINIKVDN